MYVVSALQSRGQFLQIVFKMKNPASEQHKSLKSTCCHSSTSQPWFTRFTLFSQSGWRTGTNNKSTSVCYKRPSVEWNILNYSPFDFWPSLPCPVSLATATTRRCTCIWWTWWAPSSARETPCHRSCWTQCWSTWCQPTRYMHILYTHTHPEYWSK